MDSFKRLSAKAAKSGKELVDTAVDYARSETTPEKLEAHRQSINEKVDKATKVVVNLVKNREQIEKDIKDKFNKFRTQPLDHATGLVLIFVGLFLVFRGRAAFKVFLALSGFVMGGSVGLYLTHFTKYIPASWNYTPVDWHMWVFTLVLAIAGVIFVTKAYKYSVALISMFSGVYTAVFAIQLIPFAFETYQKYLIMAAFALIFFALSRKFEEAVIISSTAIMGAFTTVFGVDSIVNIGFRTYVESIIAISSDDKSKAIDAIMNAGENQTLTGVLIGAVFLIISGIYIQYRFLPRGYDKDWIEIR